ncbi:MAG: radical SAM protein [Deltaproteobacteria bacterium]|nr:radical SAM protein [Deltaproteobacteria bacterium]
MIPKMRALEFQLMQSCNARCIYCAYEQGYPRHEGFLPLELVERTLAEVRPAWAWFEGGEVTATEASRAHLLEAMRIARRLGVRNRINTNAQALTPDSCHALREAGLEFACVSFDTLDPDRYGLLRGYPPEVGRRRLDELRQNAIALLDEGVTVDLEATLTRHNVGDLLALYDHAESLATGNRNVLMGVQFLVATYDKLFGLCPEVETMARAMEALLRRAERGRIPVRICCSPLVPCMHAGLYEHANAIWLGCTCGFDYAHVHANGDVLLCGFWDHGQPLGNLHERSFSEIWETSRMRREALAVQPEACRGCESWEGKHRCHNSCMSVVHRKTGAFAKRSYDLMVAAEAERR